MAAPGGGVALYEPAELCKDPRHKIWGVAATKLLQQFNLITTAPDGRATVHNSIRNIVLSMVEEKDSI
jgi:hypothetical protein